MYFSKMENPLITDQYESFSLIMFEIQIFNILFLIRFISLTFHRDTFSLSKCSYFYFPFILPVIMFYFLFFIFFTRKSYLSVIDSFTTNIKHVPFLLYIIILSLSCNSHFFLPLFSKMPEKRTKTTSILITTILRH